MLVHEKWLQYYGLTLYTCWLGGQFFEKDLEVVLVTHCHLHLFHQYIQETHDPGMQHMYFECRGDIDCLERVRERGGKNKIITVMHPYGYRADGSEDTGSHVSVPF